MSTSTGIFAAHRRANIYVLDAIISLSFAIVFIGFSATLLGLFNSRVSPTLLTGIGFVLIPWAAFNYWSGRRHKLGRAGFGVHMAVDWCWVAASAIMLITEFSYLSLEGRVLIAFSMLAVAGVAATKLATTALD